MTGKPDFPFYNDQPSRITAVGWLVVLASTGLAFYLLTGPILLVLPVAVGLYAAPMLFAGIPLIALHLVSKGHGLAVFRRYTIKSFGLSLGFAVLTIGVSVLVALILSLVSTFTANPAGTAIEQASGAGLAIFLSRTFFQLVGEEVVTILPLLAVLWFCVQKLHLSKGIALAIAVLLSTAWFAAMHLPTYDWNYLQCFGIIGSARLVLTAAYLLTRNLWVSTGAHIINDWSIFVFTYAGAHIPVEA